LEEAIKEIVGNFKKCIIVPHTHWDREWYLSFQEYRLRLVKVLDKVIKLLKEGTLPFFLLDGQVSALEDYLEVRPEAKREVEELVSRGALAIGPWYTQPDEFLVSGESLIRNLLIGIKEAEKYGGYLKVGYLPDTFGHIAQLPQILKGFGMDCFIFSRGLGDEGEELGSEFLWEAPDGSKVYAVHLLQGYCNAAHLGVKGLPSPLILTDPYSRPTIYYDFYEEEPEVDVREALSKVVEIARSTAKYSKSKVLLLMNGCDHLPPQANLKKLVDKLNSEAGREFFKIGNLSEYLEEVKACKGLGKFKGELRGARYRPILWNVYSTRCRIKELNFKSQKLLESYAEPLSVLNWILRGAPYPRDLLNYLWKELLRNHAHDSIYGTGIDEVHLINEARFLRVIEGAGNLALLSLYALGREAEGPNERIVVYNPLNWEVKGPVEVIVPSGKGRVGEVPSQAEELGVYGLRRLTFIASVPPLGYKVYSLHNGELKEGELGASDTFLENEFLRVEVSEGGLLKLVDKRNGAVYEGLNLFLDEGDVGDEYDYEPTEDGIVVTSGSVRAYPKMESKGPVKASLKIHLKLMVPKCAIGKRRAEDKVELPIEVTLSLYRGLPRLDVKVKVVNYAEDHRLRVELPTGIKGGRVVVGSQFYLVERAKEPVKGEGWVERPQATGPMLEWVAVVGRGRGLMVATRGIYEYEAYEGEEGTSLRLTLFRGIGWLSRGDLRNRRGHAGPPLPTPNAQCKGELTFEYSLIPLKGGFDVEVIKRALEYTTPLMGVFIEGGGGKLPPSFSFARLSPEGLIISALKASEDGRGVILRFYDLTGSEREVKVEFFKEPLKVMLTNLLEEEIDKLKGKPTFRLRGFGIATLKAYFK